MEFYFFFSTKSLARPATPPRSPIQICAYYQYLQLLQLQRTSRTVHHTTEDDDHIAINSRLNTASQPSKGSNTSQCTVSSHLCLASSMVGGGGAVREGRTNFGIVVLSAAYVSYRIDSEPGSTIRDETKCKNESEVVIPATRSAEYRVPMQWKRREVPEDGRDGTGEVTHISGNSMTLRLT